MVGSYFPGQGVPDQWVSKEQGWRSLKCRSGRQLREKVNERESGKVTGKKERVTLKRVKMSQPSKGTGHTSMRRKECEKLSSKRT